MRKDVLLGSMVITIIMLLVACCGQQGSLHGTNNDTDGIGAAKQRLFHCNESIADKNKWLYDFI